MSDILMIQEKELATPGIYHLDKELKKLANQSQKSGQNYRRRNRRYRRKRKPAFVIPPLPEFVPPEVPNVVIQKRDPNIPRIILPMPRFYEGPETIWPAVDNFYAVYIGMDENNRIVLKFLDEKSVECYYRMRSNWGVFHVTLGKDDKIPLCDVEIGLLVMACNKKDGQDHFFRAKVLSIQKDGGTVTVRDVDEWDIVVIREENLYWMNTAFLALHFQAITCELRGLNFFKEIPLPKNIIEKTLRKFPPKGVVRVLKFRGRHPYPLLTFSIWPFASTKYPVNEQVQNILIKRGPILPRCAGAFSEHVLTSHADELGNIWLQMGSTLTYFLTQLKLDKSEDLPTASCPEEIETAIISSLENGEKLFLGQYMDEHYFRCRVLSFSPEDKLAKVYFVDFGNTSSIKISEMMTYERFFGEDGVWVKYIKPQCVKVHMNKIDVINLDTFWEHVTIDTRQDIMISLSQRQDRKTPQVELYIYPNGNMQHLNKFFLRKSNVARNIGERKIGTNIRIPGTKKYLTDELVASYEDDFVPEEIWTEDNSSSEGSTLGIDMLFN